MYEVYAGILKMNETFRASAAARPITYETDADYSRLTAAYPLLKIAGGDTDYSKMKNLLSWEASHISHKGDYDGHVKNTAMDLFAYALDTENGINCRSLSMALAECLLAAGIQARVIYMFPFSPYDCDNHVVCEAWAGELGKWIMLDPTYNAILLNVQKEPLNIMEIRKMLADRKKLYFSAGLNYNGSPVDEKEVIEYYAKNMFWFSLRDIQGSDSESRNGRHTISIVPEGYDTVKSRLVNIDYRIECWGEDEALNEWKKQVGNDTPIYKSLSDLY